MRIPLKLCFLFFSACVVIENKEFPIDEPIVAYRHEELTVADLSPAARNRIYRAELERFAKIREAVLDEIAAREGQRLDKERGEASKNELVATSDLTRGFGEELRQVRQQRIAKELQEKGELKFYLLSPEAPFTAIRAEGFPSNGQKDARVQIYQFFDFQCGHCQGAHTWLGDLTKRYADSLQITYVGLPLHDSSRPLLLGGLCAASLGQYETYADLAYSGMYVGEAGASEIAKTLHLDEVAFRSCMGAPETRKRLEVGIAEAARLGVSATPTFFVNGEIYYKNLAALTFEESIKAKLTELAH